MIKIRKLLTMVSFLFVAISVSVPSIHADFGLENSPEMLDSSRALVQTGKAQLAQWWQSKLSKAIGIVSAPLKQVISHYRDPRLIGLIALSLIVASGGVYLVCKKEQANQRRTNYDKITGAACIGFGIANIMLSHYSLGLADRYFPHPF